MDWPPKQGNPEYEDLFLLDAPGKETTFKTPNACY
jgi:hypothetical protein